MTQTITKAKTFASGFTSGQRAVVVVAVLGLLLGAFALSRWVSQPTWAPLYGNLSGTDANAIVDQLNTDGVPYKLADGGTSVLVPQSQVYAERISLSGKGLPESSSTDGWSLLDKQGITATDFQQNVAYQRALSGELSKTLEAMTGVNTAIVQLAIPAKSVFSTDTDKTTASVLLSLQPGTTLSSEQVRSITHLVAGSVANLSPDSVTVSDQNGTLLSGSSDGAAGAAANANQTDQQTAAYEDRLSSAVQNMLNAVVGTGHSTVRVNAQLDFNDTKTTSETYAAPSPSAPPLSAATVNEKYTGNGTNAGGTLGQILPTPVASASGAGQYSRSQSTVNNSVDKTVQVVQAAPGTVQRMTVAVVLDSKTAGSLNPTQIQSLVSNAVGFNAKRGDSVQVTSLPFDTTAAAAAQKQLAAAAKDAKTASYIDLAKKVGLVLLAIIVVIIFMRRRKRMLAEQEEQTRIEATARDLPNSGLVLNQAGTAINHSQQLALTQESDASRDRMRDEVSALVDSSPDDVAAMLQGWLAERKS
jgi:flagellar M-ring protein FliF